jgi:hypothetical protein
LASPSWLSPARRYRRRSFALGLTAGLIDLPVPRPSEKALGDALLNGTLDYRADVGT